MASDRYWLEITDRTDVGTNLNAPLFDKNGNANWTYDLVREIKDGDKVFHYTKAAIVGVSRACGQPWLDDVIWAAKGAASRNARIEPHLQPGQYLALEGYEAIEPPLTLAEIRIREAEILEVREELLAEKGGALRFPFIRYGDQGLRAFQAYLVEFPFKLAQLFPTLMEAASRLQQQASIGLPIAPLLPRDVGATYRPADENASAAQRDPFAIDPAHVERGCRGHAATQNALAAFIRKRGIEPLSPASHQINFDLGWQSPKGFFVAEVKSCTEANVEKQLRLGLGQVLRYRSVLEDTLGGRIEAVLALEAPLADASWRRLCDTLGVHLVAGPHFEELEAIFGVVR